MRVEEDNETIDSVTQTDTEVETSNMDTLVETPERDLEYVKYNPDKDEMSKWLMTLTNAVYAAQHPEHAIAARLVGRMEIVPVDNVRLCPMMAVRAHRGRHILMYNPRWLQTVSFTEFTATIVHEAYHVIYGDIPRFLRRLALFAKEEQMFASRVLNVALDAANNALMADRMPHLKYGTTGYWVMPEPLDLPPKDSSEVYFDILVRRARKLKERIEEMRQQCSQLPSPVMPPKDEEGGDSQGDESEESGGQDEKEDEEQGEDDGEGQGQGQQEQDDGDGEEQGDPQKQGGGGQDAQGGGEDGEDTQQTPQQGPSKMDLSDCDKALMEAVQHLLNENAHDWQSQAKEEGEEGEAQYGTHKPMTPEELEAMAQELENDGRRKVVKAIREHESRHHGTMPAHLEQRLQELLDEGKIHWTEYLRQLVTARVAAERYKTNRQMSTNQYILWEEDEDGRYIPLPSPLPHFPGTEIDRTFCIMWALDTSGSMSQDDILDGLSELQGMIRTDPNIHIIVVQCDTHISDVSLLTPEEDLEKYIEEVGRTSGGGTAFDEPFKLLEYIEGRQDEPNVRESKQGEVAHLLEEYEKVDLIVYHTDGYAPAPDIELEPPCPVLWCVTADGTNPGYAQGELFGQIIER